MPPKRKSTRRPASARIPDAAQRIAEGRAQLADQPPAGPHYAEQLGAMVDAEAGTVATALERAANAPIPKAYRAEWWPAMVRTPEGDVFRVAKVYATAEGLYVYARPPRQEDRPTGGTPTWFAPINYEKTRRPPTGYAARQKGVQVVTDAGTVTVTPLGGCGCAFATLKAWRPNWATRNEAWEAPA